MGTNYYLVSKEKTYHCEKCGYSPDRRHIGKSSGGWAFMLRVYPEIDIHDINDWDRLFADTRFYIENEYGDIISAGLMLNIITDRPKESRHSNPREWPEGFVRRGAGTWDVFELDFS